MRSILFCILFLSTALGWSQIQECSSIAELKKYAKEDTLVIFDLDNTLIRPKQMLGSDEWFRYYLEKKTSEYNDRKRALNDAINTWQAIQTISPMCCLESCTNDLVKDLQKIGTPLMVLTTRDHAFFRGTVNQLRSLDFDFTKTAPVKGFYRIDEMPDVAYEDGILYSDGYHKGRSLLHFFKQSSFWPKKVIFIDDKLSWVTQLDVLESEGIEYLGLRYAGADKYVSNFDPGVAEHQFQRLMNALHDGKINEPVVQ